MTKSTSQIADLSEIKTPELITMAQSMLARSADGQLLVDYQKVSRHMFIISELYNSSDMSNKMWAGRSFSEASRIIKKLRPFELLRSLIEIRGIGPAIQREVCCFIINGYKSNTEKATRLSTRCSSERTLRWNLEPVVSEVLDALEPVVSQIEVAGSYRRGSPTCKDLDFVISLLSSNSTEMMVYRIVDALSDLDGWVFSYGREKRISGTIAGFPVDFRIMESHESFEAAMLFFTGPAASNIQMRSAAKSKGWKLNEYGLFDRETDEYILPPESPEYEYFELLAPDLDPMWLKSRPESTPIC